MVLVLVTVGFGVVLVWVLLMALMEPEDAGVRVFSVDSSGTDLGGASRCRSRSRFEEACKQVSRGGGVLFVDVVSWPFDRAACDNSQY